MININTENMTNGDVMKAIFPDIEVRKFGVVTEVKGLDCSKEALLPYRHFWTDWWNAPYSDPIKGVVHDPIK